MRKTSEAPGQYKWIAEKLSDFFGWSVFMVGDTKDTNYIIVRAVKKGSNEMRMVKAHISVVPADAVENLGNR